MPDPYVYPGTDILKNILNIQGIYEWAGKIRTINMEKEEPALGGLSTEYSDKTEIMGDLSGALENMASRPWAVLSLNDRVKCFSEDLAAVWFVKRVFEKTGNFWQ